MILMRYLLVLLLLWACNPPAPPPPPPPAPVVDTVVWIGIHARWNYAPGTEYDGNYDTSNQVFIVCNTDRSSVVPRTNVILETGGSCDTSVTNRIRLMEIRRHDTVATTIGHASSVDEGTVSFKTARGEKAVQLKAEQTLRIRQLRVLRAPVRP